jgi:septum site-determining protein MinD
MILAVAGGKGGVGKSTVAYNLAGALTQRVSRRSPRERRAVAVDADLGMANLPFGHGPDLHDVLAGRACPVEAVRHGPVSVLPCGRSLAGARAADLRRLADALRDVEREYGDVVVDCPAGMRSDAGVPLAVADACLLVTTPDRFAVADVVRTREFARELDCGLLSVVLNRADDACASTVETFERLLGAPVVPLPTDAALARSVETGCPVVTDETHPVAARFEALAEAVTAARANNPNW